MRRLAFGRIARLDDGVDEQPEVREIDDIAQGFERSAAHHGIGACHERLQLRDRRNPPRADHLGKKRLQLCIGTRQPPDHDPVHGLARQRHQRHSRGIRHGRINCERHERIDGRCVTDPADRLERREPHRLGSARRPPEHCRLKARGRTAVGIAIGQHLHKQRRLGGTTTAGQARDLIDECDIDVAGGRPIEEFAGREQTDVRHPPRWRPERLDEEWDAVLATGENQAAGRLGLSLLRDLSRANGVVELRRPGGLAGGKKTLGTHDGRLGDIVEPWPGDRQPLREDRRSRGRADLAERGSRRGRHIGIGVAEARFEQAYGCGIAADADRVDHAHEEPPGERAGGSAQRGVGLGARNRLEWNPCPRCEPLVREQFRKLTDRRG